MNDGPTSKSQNPFGIRDFRLYLAGIGCSQVGTQGTMAAMLYHVYVLSGSTWQVGIVGAVNGVATIAFAPWAGHLADRVNRKLLLQFSQVLAFAAAVALAVLTTLDLIRSWHIWVGMLVTAVAATLDSPVRKAILPGVVPREALLRAVTIVNPTTQVGKLAGPGLAGVLIALRGPELMYLFDAGTYLVFILVFIAIKVPPLQTELSVGVLSSLRTGVAFVRARPIVYHLIAIDVAMQLFTAWRVVLPAIALDHLHVGPTGYGLLSAAVPAGGLVGGFIAYALAHVSFRVGWLLLIDCAAYGGAAILLARNTIFLVAVLACVLLGMLDAIGTSYRQAAVMLETPDELQGRVQGLYFMSARGGPALGEFNVGLIAGAIGAVTALSLGGIFPMLYAVLIFWRVPAVRNYRGSSGHRTLPVEPVGQVHPAVGEPPVDEQRRTT